MDTYPAATASSPPLRILIVEDSTFFRRQLVRLLEEAGNFEVVGEASNGREAVKLAADLRPDLITMDVEMPVMDGIDAVREIMRSTPTRIVMLSAFTLEGAEATLGALDAGALDFIAKRTLGGGPASDGARQLIAQLRAVAASPIARSARQSVVASVLAKPAPQPTPASVQAGGLGALGLLVLGASTGGPALLGELMAAVPAGFPAPILLVVHMPQGFTGFFAERLSRRCRLPVIEAVDGAPLIPGQVLLAPGGMQTRLRRVRSQLVTEILPGTADALYRPSIDFVLESVAAELGPQALAVILTGMGNDGTRGAASVVKSGGRVWAQDQASSAVFGMPSSVVRAGHVSRVVSVTELAQLLDGSR